MFDICYQLPPKHGYSSIWNYRRTKTRRQFRSLLYSLTKQPFIMIQITPAVRRLEKPHHD